MRLCAFADESDKTLEGQIAALHRNGIDLIELRNINKKNILDILIFYGILYCDVPYAKCGS